MDGKFSGGECLEAVEGEFDGGIALVIVKEEAVEVGDLPGSEGGAAVLADALDGAGCDPAWT